MDDNIQTKHDRLRTIPIANECRHFTGLMNKKCNAGILYEDVSRVATEGRMGCALRLPCWHACENEYPCESLSRLTTDEVRHRDKELNKAVSKVVKRMSIVRPAIINSMAADNWNQFVQGSIKCPICKKGVVKFTYSGHVNGHIHAACNTPDCISWGE